MKTTRKWDLPRYQGAFNFPFSIGRNSLSIVQHGDKFELRINNQSFSHLYENSKSRSPQNLRTSISRLTTLNPKPLLLTYMLARNQNSTIESPGERGRWSRTKRKKCAKQSSFLRKQPKRKRLGDSSKSETKRKKRQRR
jgi:hypothetical protein